MTCTVDRCGARYACDTVLLLLLLLHTGMLARRCAAAATLPSNAPQPPAASSQRSISTWVGWESSNVSANYAAVMPYIGRISSISLALPLPPLVPVEPPDFNETDVRLFTKLMRRAPVPPCTADYTMDSWARWHRMITQL